MLSIAVIGCGQIGSRHLQALASLNESATIYLIDLSGASIRRAKQLFNESHNSVVDFELIEAPISGIEVDIDVAIVASSSSVRKQLVVELLDHCKVKHLILEKFLFQKPSDYTEIAKLLKMKMTKAWVNQWLSSSYAFLRIAKLFEDSACISMNVYGNEWGLACNAVHFIDYFDLLTGDAELMQVDSDLDAKILDSKREGYKEFTGRIQIKTECNNSTLSMESGFGESNGEIYIDIQGQDNQCKLVLHSDRLMCKHIDKNGYCTDETYNIPFQSQVTHMIVHELMLTGRCQLPDYESSSLHHKLILPVFYKHLVKFSGWTLPNCPIT